MLIVQFSTDYSVQSLAMNIRLNNEIDATAAKSKILLQFERVIVSPLTVFEKSSAAVAGSTISLPSEWWRILKRCCKIASMSDQQGDVVRNSLERGNEDAILISRDRII